MNTIAKILVKRDGMTLKEATKYVRDEMKCVRSYIEDGDFMGAEDYFQDVFGLEPDYLFNAIM